MEIFSSPRLVNFVWYIFWLVHILARTYTSTLVYTLVSAAADEHQDKRKDRPHILPLSQVSKRCGCSDQFISERWSQISTTTTTATTTIKFGKRWWHLFYWYHIDFLSHIYFSHKYISHIFFCMLHVCNIQYRKKSIEMSSTLFLGD